jgi:secondary thiamine-phosphate synthase enzyme
MPIRTCKRTCRISSHIWPSHIRSALTQTSIGIPLHKGGLALGTWQGIYVFEHRDAPHRREVTLHVMGD